MIKYSKEVTNRYFRKTMKCSINNVNEGDIVHITVRSPLHYGIKEWSYYGRIVRITRCYFSIVQYFEAASFGGIETNYCSASHAELLDQAHKTHAKRWAKDSLISIHLATFEDVAETREYYRSESVPNSP